MNKTINIDDAGQRLHAALDEVAASIGVLFGVADSAPNSESARYVAEEAAHRLQQMRNMLVGRWPTREMAR